MHFCVQGHLTSSKIISALSFEFWAYKNEASHIMHLSACAHRTHLVHQQNENTTWQLSSHALNARLKPPIRDQTHFLWKLMEVSSFRNVFNLCHLSLYWCAQTFPLPWHTSCSLLHVQETLQMSIWFRTGKHNICSNNSAGKSVNCLATLSEITAFVPKTRSPVNGVAIFSVYSDDINEAPPSCQRKHAPLWCKGLNHIL